jgi:CDGSH-type Zn-finger protein
MSTAGGHQLCARDAIEPDATAARHAEGGAIVTPYPDGPLLLRGNFSIVTVDGEPVPAGRRTVALCRCGHSALKPFCDGSHARTGFRSGDQAARCDAAAERSGRVSGAAQPLPRVADAAAQSAGEGQPAAG